ncbi:uncharacterized protein METZ01_LOCUS188761, partial [marine metagenome]
MLNRSIPGKLLSPCSAFGDKLFSENIVFQDATD